MTTDPVVLSDITLYLLRDVGVDRVTFGTVIDRFHVIVRCSTLSCSSKLRGLGIRVEEGGQNGIPFSSLEFHQMFYVDLNTRKD